MSELTDFLLARIAEDEDRIVHEFDCERFNVTDYGTRQGKCDCDATGRLKAECGAKRRIVAELERDHERHSRESYWMILRLLALPYADHRDYREEWRP